MGTMQFIFLLLTVAAAAVAPVSKILVCRQMPYCDPNSNFMPWYSIVVKCRTVILFKPNVIFLRYKCLSALRQMFSDPELSLESKGSVRYADGSRDILDPDIYAKVFFLLIGAYVNVYCEL